MNPEEQRAAELSFLIRLPDARRVSEGTLIALTSGKHDDYRLNCLVRAKMDFDFSVRQQAFDSAPENQRLLGVDRFSRFLAFLLDGGAVEMVDAAEFNLNDYPDSF